METEPRTARGETARPSSATVRTPAPLPGAVNDRPSPGAAVSAVREGSATVTPAADPSDTPATTGAAPAATEPGAPDARTALAPTAGDASGARDVPVERASTPSAPARTAAPAPVPLQAVPGLETQLAAKAREFVDRGRTELRIALDPPSLGKLRVRLELSEGRAVAHIVAATPEAAALLGREREDLMRAFQAQGFDSVDVHVDSETESAARGRDGREDDDDGPSDGSAPSPDRTVRLPRRANTLHSRSVDLFV